MTTSHPTDIEFYANHTDEQIEAVVERMTATSAYIAINSGSDHFLALEAMSTANAAWTALQIRKARAA